MTRAGWEWCCVDGDEWAWFYELDGLGERFLKVYQPGDGRTWASIKNEAGDGWFLLAGDDGDGVAGVGPDAVEHAMMEAEWARGLETPASWRWVEKVRGEDTCGDIESPFEVHRPDGQTEMLCGACYLPAWRHACVSAWGNSVRAIAQSRRT